MIMVCRVEMAFGAHGIWGRAIAILVKVQAVRSGCSPADGNDDMHARIGSRERDGATHSRVAA